MLPDAQRGYDNYNKAAQALGTMVTNPAGVIDAAIEPVRPDWNAGNKTEAIGRATFEVGSVLVGAGVTILLKILLNQTPQGVALLQQHHKRLLKL